MNRKGMCILTALSAGCLWAAMSAAAEPPDRPPEEAPEAGRERGLAEAIEAIAAAEDPDSAAAAYARGNNLDSSSIRLHETFMVRLLKFGLPKTAVYPARALVGLDRNHALAWSVIGYVHGCKGELAKAFDATMTAVKNMQDDPSVLSNAGQLAAWYDHERKTPNVSAAAHRLLEQMRNELAGKKEFAASYENIANAYKQLGVVIAEYDRKLSAIEAEVLTLQRQFAQAESDFRTIANEIDARNLVINDLKAKLSYWYSVHLPHHETYAYDDCIHNQDDLKQQIYDEEAAVDRLWPEAYRIRNEAQAIYSEAKVREKSLGPLRAERDQAVNQVYRHLAWGPPAVDGVVTLEVERFEHRKPEPVAIPDDPEVLAAQRLRVARLYITNSLSKKAMEILAEIVATRGSTNAAQEAKSLLETMIEVN